MNTIGTVVVAALAANAGAARSQGSAKVSRVELRSIPTTGIAGCYARAARGLRYHSARHAHCWPHCPAQIAGAALDHAHCSSLGVAERERNASLITQPRAIARPLLPK